MRDQRQLGGPPHLRHGARAVGWRGQGKEGQAQHRAVCTRGLERWLTFPNYTHSELRFCALLLTEGAWEVQLALS
jgi:hypothetical protein